MKIAVTLTAVAALLAATLFLAAPFQAPPPDLAAAIPAGPLLYLEARDFGALLHDWNASPEKRAWLDSANYEVFSRSRLFGRLEQAWQEFTATAGFTPGMTMVESISGGHSAVALYDIGKLEFLYISTQPAAHAMESILWQSRAKYESRQAGGSPFYVRIDPASGRVAAFAVYHDYLLLATRDELVAGALRLLAGEKIAAVNQDPWFAESVHAVASPPGDLRLVMNLESIIRTPYFRSYWVQRNTSELKPYWAGIADVSLSAPRIREDRVLLRRGTEASPHTVAGILQLVPDDAGLYRAWGMPSTPTVVALVRDKLLATETSRFDNSQYAPEVPQEGNAGNESDLETRIDEAPLVETAAQFDAGPLRNLLDRAGVQAMLHVESSRVLPDGVFVETPSAVALIAASDWDSNAVRAALAGGAPNVEFAARGHLLVLANSASLLRAVLSRAVRAPAPSDATYAAGFRYAAERANFEKMMTALDYNKPQPTFFSGNIASLGRVLSRVASETITVRDRGSSLAQTVIYETPQRPPAR